MLPPEPQTKPAPPAAWWTAVWEALTGPATAVGSGDRRRAQRLSALLLLLTPSQTVAALMAFGLAPAGRSTLAWLLAGVALLLGVAYFVSRTRFYRAAAAAAVVMVAILPGAALAAWGSADLAALTLATAAGLLGLLVASQLFGLTSLLLAAGAQLAGLAWLPALFPALAVPDLAVAAGLLAVGAGLLAVVVRYYHRLEQDQHAALAQAQRELQASQVLLDTRTRDLERRTAQLVVAADVGRTVSALLHVEPLLARVVELIRDRFGFYHVSIFLMDDSGQSLVLREATGPVGARLKADGYRLPLEARSIVGWVASTRQPRVIADVRTDPSFLSHALLPETRAEAALPLRAGERLIGVLDVQSRKPAAFAPADLDVLQILADQVGVALENGLLFARQQRLLQLEQLVLSLTTKIHQTVELEAILESAAADLGRALGAGRAVVRLQAAPTSGPDAALERDGQPQPGHNGHAAPPGDGPDALNPA